jgi:uncharacterized repeat protein (TIGR01451 family)
MMPSLRRMCLMLLTAGLGALCGCHEMGQAGDPLTGLGFDVGRVHTAAKPAGPGYLSNFDPHLCKIEVCPMEATNPVRTQHVLIATVYDENGQPRRGRKVEWMLEGVGNIIEADESGLMPGHSSKITNQYAVSTTNYTENRVSRGTGNPNDDIVIHPGQTWCVISSSVEGDSHVTVYAPEIPNWDCHKVFVTKHWVDADWLFPKPAVNRAGTEHTFTTNVFRHTDHQPLTNYRVRYRILDGPPAMFLPSRAQEWVATSDLNGNACATLVQLAPLMGTNRIGIDVIRPPDPSLPSGAGIVVGHGETTKEWQAPQVTLSKVGPSSAAVGQEIPYTITVTNAGQVESRPLTVIDQIAEGMAFVRADPPVKPDGSQLVWTLSEVPAGQSRSIQVVFQATAPGKVTNTALVRADDGLKDQKTVSTEIVTPQLKVTKTGPATGVVGAPVVYEITLTNPGTGPATNVMLKDSFDPGLEHESKANPLELTVGTLAPQQSKTVRLTLTPRLKGRLVSRVAATADGGLAADAQHAVEVQEPKLTIKQTAPAWRYSGRPVDWNIEVTNAGEVPLNNVAVHDQLPPEVTFASATAGGLLSGGQVVWNLGTLQPHEHKTLQLSTKCVKLSPQAVNVAVATADPGVEVQDRAAIEIRGLPAFRLEVYDLDDPVELNGKTTYKVEVTNQGTLPGNQVQVTGIVPPQMKVLGANGPAQPKIDGQTVTFPPVESLAPQQTLTYSIEVQAIQVGDVRFRAELRSTTLSAPVIEEESTNIYALPPGSEPAPAAPRATGAPPARPMAPAAPPPARPAAPTTGTPPDSGPPPMPARPATPPATRTPADILAPPPVPVRPTTPPTGPPVVAPPAAPTGPAPATPPPVPSSGPPSSVPPPVPSSGPPSSVPPPVVSGAPPDLAPPPPVPTAPSSVPPPAPSSADPPPLPPPG